MIDPDESTALIEWADIKGYPYNLLLAISNRGQRLSSNGIPNMFLPLPRKGYRGLFVLVKPKGSKVANSQRWAIDMLSGQGYRTVVCWGWIEARDAIEQYLSTEAH